MQKIDIHLAASQFIKRRLHKQRTPRLAAALRPTDIDQAFAIQKAIVANTVDSVGGWKCLLPNGDKLIAAPIFSSTVYSKSPAKVQLENGQCRMEPEIAFCFKQDLLARNAPYCKAEISAALGSANLALELILNRFSDDEKVPYLEGLADCLFNQGLFIGPEITLEQACCASEFSIILSQTTAYGETERRDFCGKHPNQYPHLPLFWLVNFLTSNGIDILAGQQIITGSYAGVINVLPNLEFTVEYQGLGVMNVILES